MGGGTFLGIVNLFRYDSCGLWEYSVKEDQSLTDPPSKK
jgi:hypothetical protein